MTKSLLTTTALVASAGIASAQGVALSGSAELGIYGGTNIETQFWSDIDITFTFSGETDNGLTFGGTIDLDEVNDSNGAFNPTAGGSGGPDRNLASVFLSGNFGTITMGDTDGAFDWALRDLDIVGDLSDANTTHDGFSGNAGLDGTYDGQIARYEYSFGDFAFAVSAELDDTGANDPIFGIGGKYSGTLGSVEVGVGVGYQSEGTHDILGLSLDAEFFDGHRAILNYSDLDGLGGRESHLGVGIFHRFAALEALLVGLNYGQYDLTSGDTQSGYGIAANFDLGGGAVVQFGYGHGESGAGVTADQFSLGIAMSF